MSRRQRIIAAGFLLVALLAAAACGSATKKASSHNAQDVVFVQGMIPHHQSAITMAKMASQQASSADVKVLATRIEAAQGPEIAKMQGWLKDWGASGSTMSGPHDMAMKPDMSMGGMTDAEMQQLGTAQGPVFDRLFVTFMIKHHQGAVGMAGTELAKGQNVDAKQLASSIKDSQTKEIIEMQTLLQHLPAV